MNEMTPLEQLRDAYDAAQAQATTHVDDATVSMPVGTWTYLSDAVASILSQKEPA